MYDVAGYLARSGFFPDLNTGGGRADYEQMTAAAFAKIMRGASFGLDPVSSLSAIHFVKGQTELHATLVAALILSSGRYDYADETPDDEKAQHCVIAFYRVDGAARRFLGRTKWSIERAHKAGLGLKQGSVDKGSNWYKHPAQMLFARCITEGRSRYCPDVSFSPIYALGEVDESETYTTDYAAEGQAVQGLAPTPSPARLEAGSPPSNNGNEALPKVPRDAKGAAAAVDKVSARVEALVSSGSIADMEAFLASGFAWVELWPASRFKTEATRLLQGLANMVDSAAGVAND